MVPRLLSVVLGLVIAACSSDSPDAKAPAAAKADAEAPKAAAGPVAKPGSHEDWCDEHAVPESQCTRCDPSLVAAFKATADWCEEHGLPESQCVKCNPDIKIVRPPKAP